STFCAAALPLRSRCPMCTASSPCSSAGCSAPTRAPFSPPARPLLRRVHLTLQPPSLPLPRLALLSTAAGGHRDRADPAQGDPRRRGLGGAGPTARPASDAWWIEADSPHACSHFDLPEKDAAHLFR